MLPRKWFSKHSILLLIGLSALIKAESSSENVHERPVITPNFYDPNYHDDGRNHLRGPTAASSSSTISVMSPYAAASSASSTDAYNKPNSSPGSGGTIMAIVDHFYGPNGEEQVKYTNPTQMEKEEFEQILASIGSGGSTSSKLPYNSPLPQHSSKHLHHTQYSHSPSKPPRQPSKYGGAPLSSLYKSSSSPSYASAIPSAGYSLPSLYKSSSENSYSKPPATYRPAYSTIYKDPQTYSPSKPHHHYSKGSAEYSPPSYGSSKDPVLLHSPKEPGYLKGSSYYDSPQTGPKSISDALLAEGYTKGYPPLKGMNHIIDHDDSYPYAQSPSYPPPPSHMLHHHQPHHEIGGSNEYGLNSGKYYSPSSGMIKDDYMYGKGSLKPGLNSYPVKYAASHGPEYGISSPLGHHDAYSSGFGGGYSVEESSDPYSRPSIKGYMKRPSSSPYSSSPPSHSGGHSLSSLYEPLTFDELYSNPKAKPMYSGGSMSKPGYGHPPHSPSPYALSYGPPVEYHMPSKGVGYTTSSSPYGGPGLGLPKYKGPYRTVNTGPSGFAYGYGYGKPHNSLHDNEHKTSHNDGISVAKDEYEDDANYIRHPVQPPTVQQKHPPSPPSSLPPHLLQEHAQQQSFTSMAPPSASDESFHHPRHLSQGDLTYHHPHHHHNQEKKVPVYHPHPHSPTVHPYRLSQEINSNEISHSPPRPNNNQGESSDEVHHIHVFEKGFFGKEKRMRGKERHSEKWKPVLRNYRFGEGSGEGGHGSASMERDAQAAAEDEAARRGRRHRPPPPSRRRPMTKSNKRPYHNRDEDEEEHDEHRENGRTRLPHSRYNHHVRGGRKS